MVWRTKYLGYSWWRIRKKVNNGQKGDLFLSKATTCSTRRVKLRLSQTGVWQTRQRCLLPVCRRWRGWRKWAREGKGRGGRWGQGQPSPISHHRLPTLLTKSYFSRTYNVWGEFNSGLKKTVRYQKWYICSTKFCHLEKPLMRRSFSWW